MWYYNDRIIGYYWSKNKDTVYPNMRVNSDHAYIEIEHPGRRLSVRCLSENSLNAKK